MTTSILNKLSLYFLFNQGTGHIPKVLWNTVRETLGVPTDPHINLYHMGNLKWKSKGFPLPVYMWNVCDVIYQLPPAPEGHPHSYLPWPVFVPDSSKCSSCPIGLYPFTGLSVWVWTSRVVGIGSELKWGIPWQTHPTSNLHQPVTMDITNEWKCECGR